MPIYEYKCSNCNEVFEEFQTIGGSNENLICPKCNTPRPERIFSAFASTGNSMGSLSSGGGCSSNGPFT
jgi:putative FmdB family regulatory protein